MTDITIKIKCEDILKPYMVENVLFMLAKRIARGEDYTKTFSRISEMISYTDDLKYKTLITYKPKIK